MNLFTVIKPAFCTLLAATTRKLYEKKLLKLKEQTQELRSLIPTPTITSAENNKQNGNNDSDQYSDNEDGKNKICE